MPCLFCGKTPRRFLVNGVEGQGDFDEFFAVARCHASDFCIGHFGRLEHALADAAVQEFGGDQVHVPAAEQQGQFRLDPRQPQEPRHVLGLKLRQHVHVALWTKVIAQRRPKEG